MKPDYIRTALIDLSTGTFEIKDRADLASNPGGVGLAYQLLVEQINWSQEALAPEQPIVFARGGLAGLFPSATQVVAVFRSPLNNYLGEAHTGGNLAAAMFLAGYDALVIKGRAERPVYITVGPRIIHIKKIDPLYGTGTEECFRYLYELEPSPGIRSLVICGQGGERLIRFADLLVDRYWRLDTAGAVFGSKNLKALMIYGDRNKAIPDSNAALYREVFENLHTRLVHSQYMPWLHGLGTVLALEHHEKFLPAKNMTSAGFEELSNISARALAAKHLVRQLSCTGCPIGCVHLASYRRRFGSQSLEYEESHAAYDYELVAALGPLLGISTTEPLLALMEKLSGYGLNPAATGVLLGWLTEAFAEGLILESETGTPVEFGNVEGYLKIMDRLVEQGNDLYRLLARGVSEASRARGGNSYGLAVHGNAMLGPLMGYMSLFNLLFGSRQRNRIQIPGNHHHRKQPAADTIENFVVKMLEEESLDLVYGAFGICPLVQDLYDLKTISRALRAAGIKKSPRQLRSLGYRLSTHRRNILQRLGFNLLAVTIPERFFAVPTPDGYLDQHQLKSILEAYSNMTGLRVAPGGQ